MRHLNYIVGAHQVMGVHISEDKLEAMYNLMLRTSKNANIAQAYLGGVLWSVRTEHEYVRVTLIFKDVTTTSYSIYDGGEYDYPHIEVAFQ